MSFELDISPKERSAARFIGSVRKTLMRAAFSEKETAGITQQSIATKLGVNRSVINRMLKGDANLTLRSVAEISWALGMQAEITLRKVSDIVVDKTLTGEHGLSLARPIAHRRLLEKEMMELLKNGAIIASRHDTGNDNYAPIGVAA